MTLANNSMGGAGTTTAALSFGGNSPTTITQSWNGTNWSNEIGLSFGRSQLAGAGTQTAALAIGGAPPVTGATEEWDGTGSITRTITTTTD